MGGHFDAVGFGDPTQGFAVTREYLRATVAEGREVGRAGELVYHELETPEGCGLTAATDEAGFLLNGCPYFHGQHRQTVLVESLAPWDIAEPDQGGAHGHFPGADGSPGLPLAFALPRFALETAAGRLGAQTLNLVGLGYRARVEAGSQDPTGRSQPWAQFQAAAEDTSLPPVRRCNAECRGRIQRFAYLTNSRTAARLAYAFLDCDKVQLEIVIDLPSLKGELAEGALFQGSVWLVGRPA